MTVRSILENSTLQQVRSLRGFDFQDFVVCLMYQKYGTNGFTNLRPVRDGGCDGLILSEECAIACYGPQDATVSTYKEKLNDDYTLYVGKWKNDFPNWRFFVNFELGEKHITSASALHGNANVLWGLGRICQFIAELGYGKRIVLYRHLMIPDYQFTNDIIKNLLDDLMSERVDSTPVNYPHEAPDIEEKIRLNINEAEIDSMLALMKVSLEHQADVDSVIRPLSTNDVNTLKLRVIRDFAFAQGNNFSEKFKSLRQFYSTRYNSNDDDVLGAFIDAVLIHMFSMCHIGQEPKKEF